MLTRRLPACQKVAALAPLLVLMVSLPGQSLLRCRMDGILRSVCCCPARQELPSPAPVAKAQDCCSREVTVNQRVPADAARNAGLDVASLASAVAAPTTSLSPFGADRRPASLDRSHGPPRHGPSAVLLKHAFLI
jgi:hypothetical protein